MTVHDERDTTRTPIVPSQRRAEDARQDGDFPSREPRFRAHPRSEFWDVETANWRSRGPIPPQRFRV
jgi:hypothetical protein